MVDRNSRYVDYSSQRQMSELDKERDRAQAGTIGPDHQYYNVAMDFDFMDQPATPHTPIPAIFSIMPSQPILQNPQDYWISVVRFVVPAQLIPLFFQVGYNGGVNPNLTYESVTISYSGTDAQQFLVYVPQDLTIPVPSPPITKFNIGYYAVRSYQQFVDSINVALAAAFVSISPSLPVLVPALVAPYMIYDPQTQLFSIIADQRFVSNNIQIFFNSDLYIFFQPSFDVKRYAYDDPLGKDYQIIIKNNNNNNYIPSPVVAGISFYQMEQEAKSVNNIARFRTIVITVNNIPIKYEANTSISFNQLPVLTDFSPLLTNEAGELQTYITYFPSGQYRFSDLSGTSPIERMAIQVFWGDVYDNLFPLLIPPHDKVSIKILFQKKNINSGYK
ncbi:MAG TPA: phage minor capsid protein [Candidatus Sulfopaludibacter sp.]|nr:phage minor capsid protein [Candidatus Sulfopaludibacter sp.]